MKTKIFYLLSFMILTSFVYSQQIKELPKDKKVKLLNIFWKLDKNSIYDYYPDKDYFYRVFIIKDSEGESNLEGETKDHLFLLKGDYGEYPECQIYDLESKYNFIKCKFYEDFISIEYGDKSNPKTEEIKLP